MASMLSDKACGPQMEKEDSLCTFYYYTEQKIAAGLVSTTPAWQAVQILPFTAFLKRQEPLYLHFYEASAVLSVHKTGMTQFFPSFTLINCNYLNE